MDNGLGEDGNERVEMIDSRFDFEEILAEKVKPELNFLYTERPFEADGGLDFGWFCREHAYHGFFLAKALGFDADIRRGHVRIHDAEGEEVVTTFGETADHAWLRIGDQCPTDLSLTLRHIHADMPAIRLIAGQGNRDEYQISYSTTGDSETPQGPAGMGRIHYCETQLLSIPERDLFNDPFLLFPKPEKDGLTDVFGQDIFHQITMHLLKLAKGEINSLFGYVSDPQRAFKLISERNKAARAALESLIFNSAA